MILAWLFLFVALGIRGELANAATHSISSSVSQMKDEANHVGDLQHLVALLNGISDKITAEHDQENALYEEMTRYCQDRIEAAPTNVFDGSVRAPTSEVNLDALPVDDDSAADQHIPRNDDDAEVNAVGPVIIPVKSAPQEQPVVTQNVPEEETAQEHPSVVKQIALKKPAPQEQAAVEQSVPEQEASQEHPNVVEQIASEKPAPQEQAVVKQSAPEQETSQEHPSVVKQVLPEEEASQEQAIVKQNAPDQEASQEQPSVAKHILPEEEVPQEQAVEENTPEQEGSQENASVVEQNVPEQQVKKSIRAQAEPNTAEAKEAPVPLVSQVEVQRAEIRAEVATKLALDDLVSEPGDLEVTSEKKSQIQAALDDLATPISNSSTGAAEVAPKNNTVQVLPEKASETADNTDAEKQLQQMQDLLNSPEEDHSTSNDDGKARVPAQPRPIHVKLHNQATANRRVTTHQTKIRKAHKKVKSNPARISKKQRKSTRVSKTRASSVHKMKVRAAPAKTNSQLHDIAENDSSAENEAERELQKMQATLQSQDADTIEASYDKKVVAKPVQRMSAQPKQHLAPPKVVSHYPLVHAAATPKVLRARATAPASTRQKSKKHHIPRHESPKMPEDAAPNDYSSEELQQINDLLNFAPPAVSEAPQSPAKAEMAPNTPALAATVTAALKAAVTDALAAQPASIESVPASRSVLVDGPMAREVAAPTIKPDKDADSVVADSEALESMIDEEETNLRAADRTRQAGQEARLKKQLTTAEVLDSDETAIPDEKLDSGVVHFDDRASSVVSVSGSTKQTEAASPEHQVIMHSRTVEATPGSAKQPASGTDLTDFDEAESDVASAEKEITPTADGNEEDHAATTGPQWSPAASETETAQKVELSLASQTAVLDDLAGAIPNVEKQALQLYNNYGGQPAPLESVGLASFLQVGEQKQHERHTPGIPSQAALDKAWAILQHAAHSKHIRRFQSMLQLKESKGDIDQECDWLINHFQHRQRVRVQESDWLKHAHQLLGAAYLASNSKPVYLQEQSQPTRHLRGGGH